jgi:hypothetical protein
MIILAGVFIFQPRDGMSIWPISTPKKNKVFTTVCLRRAGEIFPDNLKTANDESTSNDDKFGQLMRNKTSIGSFPHGLHRS